MQTVSEGDRVVALLYEKFPDGSDLDFNRIFDAVDKVLGSEKKKSDHLKNAKRFLFQYRDAIRNRDAIRDRYDVVFSPPVCDGQRSMKDPASRFALFESYEQERPIVSALLYKAESECDEAKKSVAWAVGLLEKEDQKLVLTAHYVSGADLKWISTVYHHWSYWAQGICDQALEKISSCLGVSAVAGDSGELDRLIDRWERDDAEFRANLPNEPFNQPLEDCEMLMGIL